MVAEWGCSSPEVAGQVCRSGILMDLEFMLVQQREAMGCLCPVSKSGLWSPGSPCNRDSYPHHLTVQLLRHTLHDWLWRYLAREQLLPSMAACLLTEPSRFIISALVLVLAIPFLLGLRNTFISLDGLVPGYHQCQQVLIHLVSLLRGRMPRTPTSLDAPSLLHVLEHLVSWSRALSSGKLYLWIRCAHVREGNLSYLAIWENNILQTKISV